MAPTESVWSLLEEDVRQDPGYRDLMVAEAAEALLDGEIEVARGLLRNVVLGAFDYGQVAAVAKMPRERVVRALRRSENVTADTVLRLLGAVQALCGIRLAVSARVGDGEGSAEAAE